MAHNQIPRAPPIPLWSPPLTNGLPIPQQDFLPIHLTHCVHCDTELTTGQIKCTTCFFQYKSIPLTPHEPRPEDYYEDNLESERFPRFKELPPELRMMVWREALFLPRIVCLDDTELLPSLLFVCNESCRMVYKEYKEYLKTHEVSSPSETNRLFDTFSSELTISELAAWFTLPKVTVNEGLDTVYLNEYFSIPAPRGQSYTFPTHIRDIPILPQESEIMRRQRRQLNEQHDSFSTDKELKDRNITHLAIYFSRLLSEERIHVLLQHADPSLIEVLIIVHRRHPPKQCSNLEFIEIQDIDLALRFYQEPFNPATEDDFNSLQRVYKQRLESSIPICLKTLDQWRVWNDPLEDHEDIYDMPIIEHKIITTLGMKRKLDRARARFEQSKADYYKANGVIVLD